MAYVSTKALDTTSCRSFIKTTIEKIKLNFVISYMLKTQVTGQDTNDFASI